MNRSGVGRLKRDPHPLLLELLYDPHLADDREHALGHLLDIDAAHVVVLARDRTLPLDTARAIVRVNRETKDRWHADEALFHPKGPHRGLYFLYERSLIDALGPEIGGAAHVGRSRNDINATITRMRMRDELAALMRYGLELADALIAGAEAHAESLMAAFTHMQPAQPGSLGHYLAGVCAEALRGLDWLAASYASIDRLPMGAAAGVGTSFATDRRALASMLGFSTVIPNSIDAVASRDYVVLALSGLALLGTTTSRIAADLQTWSSHAYGFLTWPDDLVSTSSIMPQKRNAFVLENVRGLSTAAFGALASTLATLKGAPFTNSVEVSAEATAPVWPALASASKAIRLLSLLMRELIVDERRMRAFLEGADTTMSAAVDLLVRRACIPFREAHEIVSQAVLERGAGAPMNRELLQSIAAARGRPVTVDDAELAEALEPLCVMRAAAHGGGPAPEITRAEAAALRAERARLEAVVSAWEAQIEGGRRTLERAIASLGGGP